MFFDVALLGETLAANAALKGFLSRMRPNVSVQIELLAEQLLTKGTVKPEYAIRLSLGNRSAGAFVISGADDAIVGAAFSISGATFINSAATFSICQVGF